VEWRSISHETEQKSTLSTRIVRIMLYNLTGSRDECF